MKKTFIAALAAGGLLITACSADKTDFKAAAEKTIREELEKLIDGDATADCDDPSSTDVGTTFDCTGTASDGTATVWSAEITGEKEVTVTAISAEPGTGESTDETLPAEETEETTGS